MLIGSILFSLLLLPVSAPAQAPLQRPPANQKVIKDPAEYNAYMSAINIRPPAQRAAALENFLREYPDSAVKIEALEQTMAAYQQAGNTQKLEATARRLLEIEPYNPRGLAIITFIDRAKASAGDAAALQESCDDSRKGMAAVTRLADRPDNATEGETRKLRLQMASIFLGASGFCALKAKEYATARDNFSKALQINPDNLQDNYQMGVANLEMNPVDTNGFWYLARAINLAQNQGNAKTENDLTAYATTKYRSWHGGDNGWSQIVSQAAGQSTVPAGFNVTKALTPAELAVEAVKENDPAKLSYSDWEYVLRYRDASPANKEAADQVWQAIQRLEKNGQASLTISVKIISSGKDAIQAAITDDNRNSNSPDLQVSMEKPLSRPPLAGSNVEVIGVITAYTPQPFSFTMIKGELYGQAVSHTQLSESDVLELLKGGVSSKRAGELVKQKGVDFSLDPASEARLKKAGANKDLLVAIATSRR